MAARRALLASVVACAALLLPGAARAVTETWEGTTIGNTPWETTANWSPQISGTYPDANTYTVLFTGTAAAGTAGLNPSVVLGNNETVQEVTFAAANLASVINYTISGDALTVDVNSSATTPTAIALSSGVGYGETETFSNNVTLEDTLATSKTLGVDAMPSSGTETLTFAAGGSLTFSGQAGQIATVAGGTINILGGLTTSNTLTLGGVAGTINLSPASSSIGSTIQIDTTGGNAAIVNVGTSINMGTTGFSAGLSSGATGAATNVSSDIYLTGSAITLTASVTLNSATANTLSSYIFGSNDTAATSPNPVTNTLAGTLNIGVKQAVGTVTDDIFAAPNNTFDVTGAVSGGFVSGTTGSFVEFGGGGTVEFANASNNYVADVSFDNLGTTAYLNASSVLTANGGTVKDGPLGSGTGTYVNLTNGTLEDNGTAIKVANNVTLSGNATLKTAGGGSLTFTSVIGTGTLGTLATFTLGSNSTLTVTNTSTIGDVISDGGSGYSLTKAGAGTLTLTATAGGGSDTYTGGTIVTGGVLNLGSANELASLGAVNVNGGTLAVTTFNQGFGAVTLTSGNITGSTGVVSGASYAVQSGTVSAILGGSGVALTKSTAGTVALTAVDTYTGATTVSAGALVVSGSLTGSSSTSVTNATLEGTGAITNGVTIGNGAGAAGSAVITIGLVGTTGTLSTGALTLNSDAAYHFNLNPTLGTSDRLAVNGGLALSGTLSANVLSDEILSAGQVFILATSTGITGTFTGIGDGTDLQFGDNSYQINYGDLPGYTNDLTLETVAVVPEPGTWAMLFAGAALLVIWRRRGRGFHRRIGGGIR
jgi:autotransporter-associated beta strand protein